MIRRAARGAMLAAMLAAPPLAGTAGAAAAPDPAATPLPGGLLAAPGNYSFAPPSILAGGTAEQSFGSNGARSSAVRLDSGLIGGNTRVFVAAGNAQTPHWNGIPSVNATAVSAGVQTVLPFGTLTVGVSGGREEVARRDR
ncbi:MAG: hypothetical protein INR65_18195 [Gluconacetobacter diazotrophicus]|nr:hypothetical protein [Gluconacetobacter diazotrophicus]